MKNHDMYTETKPSNSKFVPIAIVLALLVAAGIVYGAYSSAPKNGDDSSASTQSVTAPKPASVIDAEEKPAGLAMMKKEPEAMMKKEPAYVQYSDSAVAAALKEGKRVYVFFHATWCPSCKALDSDIEKNLSTIPANTLIFKADYDSETALKQKYGVTVQTTVITLNSDGSLANKALGVGSLSELLK